MLRKYTTQEREREHIKKMDVLVGVKRGELFADIIERKKRDKLIWIIVLVFILVKYSEGCYGWVDTTGSSYDS